MSDISGPRKQGIPAWQRTQATSSISLGGSEKPTQKEEESTSRLEDKWPSIGKPMAETQEMSEKARDALREQAQKFLQEPSVRDAPTEQKLAFLKSKGLAENEFEKALDSTDTENSNLNVPISGLPSEKQHPTLSSAVLNQAEEERPPPPLPRQNIPPIITYPEFLVQPNRPPPLITARRLLNTAYLATGAAALIYGASRYLITPMVENLTSARHDFADHVNSHLHDLNDKLGEAVSIDPEKLPIARLVTLKASKENDITSDAGTSDSDPTELFHRDCGTQTSLEVANTTTVAGSESSDDSPPPDCDAVETQSKQLSRITSLCTDLNTDSSSEGQTAQEISTTIKVLNDYLYSMTYPPNAPYVPNVGPFGNESERTTDDEISRMKTEIRGVKGVLLSARHFPSGRRGMFPPAAA